MNPNTDSAQTATAAAIAIAPESPLARRVIYALSAVVIGAVAVVIYALPRRTAPGEPGILPTINAVLNGSASVFLLAGYRFIRRREVQSHKRCMLTACALSTLFLVTYLLHHAQVGSVPFHGTGALKAIYLAILLPHVLLAMVIVPLALFTIWRGYTARYAAHKRIARITLPLWLYVSVSGVVVYLMLYHLGR